MLDLENCRHEEQTHKTIKQGLGYVFRHQQQSRAVQHLCYGSDPSQVPRRADRSLCERLSPANSKPLSIFDLEMSSPLPTKIKSIFLLATVHFEDKSLRTEGWWNFLILKRQGGKGGQNLPIRATF